MKDLKSNMDKLDADKLKTGPADLKKLSENDTAKKHKLVLKVTGVEAKVFNLTWFININHSSMLISKI